VMAVVERYRAVMAELMELGLDALDVPGLFAVLDATEAGRCQLPVIEHQAINQISAQATPEQIGRSLKKVLAARLRIRPGEARRRIADAELLGQRRALTGEPLAPLWAGTAAAQRAGAINTAHLAEIGRFFHQLPCWVDASARAAAEAKLAGLAARFGSDDLRVLADRLADCLNPDGNFTDEDRARRRALSIGRQNIDGMSPIKGWLTPEAPAAPPSATMMRWWRCVAARWPPANWGPITGCRSASSSAPRCKSWKPPPGSPTPARAPGCRCPW